MRGLPSEMCISTERHALKTPSAPKYDRPIANSAAIASFRVPLKRALGVFLKSINSIPRKKKTKRNPPLPSLPPPGQDDSKVPGASRNRRRTGMAEKMKNTSAVLG